MKAAGHIYIAIDLKSFYASVECVTRGIDALTTNLVVADVSRTDKTICLAVSPSLKRHGVPGRPRLFEVVQRVRQVNHERALKAPGGRLTGKSVYAKEIDADSRLAVDYIVAPPRMAYYIDYSTRIYRLYLRHVSPADIHVYSIDEVFIDATPYLDKYGLTPRQMAARLINEVYQDTGITATAGIGTNLYLCKVAMDIEAKHAEADENGVRLAELDEAAYRRRLWTHRPLTDFWRVGRGIARRLEQMGLMTMGDVARQSVRNEEVLYRAFGVNAELLIDHAWGYEPCTIGDVKSYRPEENSISSGQVLSEPYTTTKAMVVVKEMADALALDLLDKRRVTDQLTLTIGYDAENLANPGIRAHYHGPITQDHYGRPVPRHAHGTTRLAGHTSSAMKLKQATVELFNRIVNPSLLIRRLTITALHVVSEQSIDRQSLVPVQLDLFTDYETIQRRQEAERESLDKERRMQEAVLKIKKTYGKNAILRGLNFDEGATAIERNGQIGGHKA